jgi:hypothetical protein
MLMRRNYQNSHQGYREHLGVSVRSSWENNVLLWLNKQKYKWEYEPEIFYFEDIKRGTRGYTPDMKVWKGKKSDYFWIEVKGYLKPQDKTKIRRFKKRYPEEFAKLKVITKNANNAATKFYQELNIPILAYYDDLVKEYKDKLKNWE